MKTKTFDCVEMKRRGAEKLQRRLAGMTIDQEIEYWRKRNEEFRAKQEQIKAQTGTTSDFVADRE